MKKKIRGRNIFYNIAWSQVYKYDKYDAIRILPEINGILCLQKKERNRYEDLIFYSCWRDGCRIGLKKLMDPRISVCKALTRDFDINSIYYKFSEVTSNFLDIKDIMYWLIKTYKPAFNNQDFEDSKRYKEIHLIESKRSETDIVEKISSLNW